MANRVKVVLELECANEPSRASGRQQASESRREDARVDCGGLHSQREHIHVGFRLLAGGPTLATAHLRIPIPALPLRDSPCCQNQSLNWLQENHNHALRTRVCWGTSMELVIVQPERKRKTRAMRSA